MVGFEMVKSTVYFDGSCPLCRAEIGYYRHRDQADALCFVDVSNPDSEIHQDLSRQNAMARFHVSTSNGRLLSGAAAFIAVWAELPGWRWVARVATLPGVTSMLELAYKAFLPVRPIISRAFSKLR
jgi:predicted DCC family thiol-disulfide oxidoreductase YuxK